MFVRSKQAVVLTLVLAIPALALAAASPDKAEKVAQGMLKFNQSLSTINAQIDKTLNAMNVMTKPESKLVDDYKIFSKEVDNLDKMSEKAKSNAEKMSAQRDEYLKEWQASQANIQNAQLKATSEARRAELSPKIEAMKSSFTSARTTFKPFMQDLKDLRVFLGNSLNPSGVASASDLITKCNTDGASVKADIQKGSDALNDLAGSIQPGGPPPAKK